MESFTKSSPSFTRGAFDSIPAWQSHEKTGVFVDPKTGQPKDWDWAMAGYDAAVDFPTSLYWKDLMEFYPNAKVVLGVRTNAQQWVKSFRTLEGAARRLQLFDHIVGPLIRVLTLGFVRLPDFTGTVTMLHSNLARIISWGATGRKQTLAAGSSTGSAAVHTTARLPQPKNYPAYYT